MKFFDTFAGIGGFALPLTEQGHECVGFSEINKYASQIYLSHFPSHHPYGDITRIAADALPDFDVLVGGFPCQAFSVAGKRRGFQDTRGTLFFDLCRIAKEKRPRLLVFENVKGLLSHAGGNTFATILSALDELGYDAEWQVCNSRNFGVPQNRERVYVVGHLRGEPASQVFPFDYAESVRGASRAVSREEVANCLRSSTGGVDANATLVAEAPVGRIAGWTETERRLFAFQGDEKRSSVQEHVYHKPADCTDALSTGHTPKLIEQMRIRLLTPLECERLQGFPDGWTEGLSDTQRYKCLGNAVTVNVVREIVKRLA